MEGVDEVVTETADDKGRITLGKEYAREDVKVAVKRDNQQEATN